MVATRLLLILGSIFALVYAHPSSRIVGGENAVTAAFPYAVSLRLDNAHICGGTIISTKKILTAAHCVVEKSSLKAVDKKRLSVRVGSVNQYAGGKLVQISNVELHPDYVDLKNDLAILTLAETLTLSDRVKSIPYAKTLAATPAVNSKLLVAGWGEQADGVTPYKLQHTTLTVASEEVCTDAFKDNDDSIICLNHNLKQGSCRGDAGNGAVHDGTLVAVSNFVIGACGARYPDVYSNVSYFAEWIDSVLSKTA